MGVWESQIPRGEAPRTDIKGKWEFGGTRSLRKALDARVIMVNGDVGARGAGLGWV